MNTDKSKKLLVEQSIESLFEAFEHYERPKNVLKPSQTVTREDIDLFESIDWDTAGLAEFLKTSDVVDLLPEKYYLYMVPRWLKIMAAALSDGDQRAGNIDTFCFNSGYLNNGNIDPLLKISAHESHALADTLDALGQCYFFKSQKGKPSELSAHLRAI